MRKMQGNGRAAFSYKMSSFSGIRFQAYKKGSYSEDRNQNSGQNLFIPTKREVQSQTFLLNKSQPFCREKLLPAPTRPTHCHYVFCKSPDLLGRISRVIYIYI